MARAELRPSRYGAPGSLNFHTLNDGRAIPSFAHFILSDTDRLHYPIGAIEYKAPTGTTTGGAPRQYMGINKSIFRLDNGIPTDDLTNFQGTHDAFGDVVQGMVICDGPTSGTAVLLVTFGTGNPDPDNASWTGCYYRSLTTDTAAWTKAAASDTTKLTAWGLVKAGPDLYAVCDAGRAVGLGDYRVSKCPAGSDPTLAASWGNGIEVGTPEWNITGGAAIGDSPVWGKPDGLWYYNGQTRRYDNVLRHYIDAPHPLNGKLTKAVTGGVVYTTHDGGAYFFDGVSAQEISPNKLWRLLHGRDIGNSRITAIADAGSFIDMVTETAYQSTQNAGIIVNKVTSAGAATAITTNCIDGSMATGGDVGSLAATSFIDVWADIPFVGIIIHVTRLSNSTAAAVFGSLSYSSAADTFTAFSGFIDGTRLSSNGSLSYVAFPPSASAGVVMPKDVNAAGLIQKVDFNYSSGTDVSQKYGMRIAMSGAAFDSTVEIDELEIIPARAGMPNSNGGIYDTTTNFTALDRSGLITHVYRLKRERTTGFVPHDSYAVHALPGVWAMTHHTGRLGQASGGQNLGQSIILWGRYRTIAISESPTRNPGRSTRPILATGSTTKPAPLLQIAHDWDGGDATKLKQLTRLMIETRFVQPTDKTELFAQFDDRDIVSLGTYTGGPLDIHPLDHQFRYLNLWLGFSDAATTDASAPQFIEPYILEFNWVDGDIPQDPATSTPETT